MEFSADAVAAFNAMSEGILIIDTEGVIVFGNAAYRRFLRLEMGRDPGEIVGRRLRELRPGAQLPDVVAGGEAVLQAPRKESMDIYWVNMYPIRAADGRILGGLSVVTFMAEASAFREKLESMERRSRQLLRRATKAMSSRYTFDYITARSEKSKACKDFARRIAGSDAPVLLTSESGAGKEVYAQAIHNASPAPAACSSRSTAPPSTPIRSIPSFSAMWRARSPARRRAESSACSRRRRAARCCSTKFPR